MKNRVVSLIQSVIDELNDSLPESKQISKDPDAILFGWDGQVDSLGLVELVVEVGQAVEDDYDVEVTIADEKATSQTRSPFRSIETLAEYVILLIEEARSA